MQGPKAAPPALIADDGSKPAVTEAAPLIVTVHCPVPEHPPPDQPVNIEPEVALAVSVTELPELNNALQVEPQAIPAGEDVTVPDPVPPLVMLRVY